MQNIPYGRQDINQDDIDAVVAVLKSPYITQGPAIAQFEEKVLNYCGTKHAVAISSGTAALHLAMMALDVGVGDIVWTCPISFVASANCALYVGAKIDFVDCDLATGNINIAALEIKLEKALLSKTLPKVLVVVHYSGRSCQMDKIDIFAKKYGFKIIEDAAHALGASYIDGRKVGCNKYAAITMFSFHPVKSITTGEGGVLTTNDAAIADKISILRTHGITRDADKLHNEPHGPWYYEQICLGYHYRMTDIQAALGSSQIRRLDEFISKRLTIAKYYSGCLQNLPITLPPADEHSAWHLYVIHVEPESRRRIFEYMRKNGVGVNVHYIPIYSQPYYQEMGFVSTDFPNSEQFYAGSISLPIFPSLTIDEQDYVIEKLKAAL